MSLKPPDSHFLNAATGWLELGNASEAATELERVSPTQRDQPEVPELWWRIYAERKQWDKALAVARRLMELAPEEPGGWIDLAYALHELGLTREAWAKLLPAAKKFPHVSTIAYNLACYASRLEDLPAARQWLDKAVKARGVKEIQAVALADRDLEKLWPEIRAW